MQEQVNGFNHIGVWVTDEQRSLEFYRDKLGGTVVHSFSFIPGTHNWLVDMGGGAVLELIPVGEGVADPKVGLAHIALNVKDTRKAYEIAVAAGCKTWLEPQVWDFGGKLLLAYVYGPDGEVIEFHQVLPDGQ